MATININGYELLAPLSNQNAGFSKWGFAKKDGKEYFIKEFLFPVYPLDNAPYSDSMKERIRQNCHAYEARQKALYASINKASDGNLLRVKHFFRFGSRYYTVTDRIHSDGISIASLQKRTLTENVKICIILSHSLMELHRAGLIHGDIKANNILFEKTEYGFITAKIIDIDDCFPAGDPPEKIVGDQVYYAPERALVKLQKMEPSELTCKIDVFSMGLLFHEILTGALPALPEDYTYCFEAYLDGEAVEISKKLPQGLEDIIKCMLDPSPTRRCSAEDTYHRLQDYLNTARGVASPKQPSPQPVRTPQKPIFIKPQKTQPTTGNKLRIGRGLNSVDKT